MGFSTVIRTILVLILVGFKNSIEVELTFELLENAKDCFYEDIKTNTTVRLDFQVMSGGSYDVDVTFKDPMQEIIYTKVKSQSGSLTETTARAGTYKVCFSNEFSPFSHKTVFMYFRVGEEPPLFGVEHASAMTQMEMSMKEIHHTLNTVFDHQTHLRLKDSQGQKSSEHLNNSVFLWSLMQTIFVIVVLIGQVLILKNLFIEEKSSTYKQMPV